MAVWTGADQVLVWDEDIAQPSYNAAGLVLGGELVPESGIVRRNGSCNQSAAFAGAVHYGGRVQLGVTPDTLGLLQAGVRGASPLGALKILGGTLTGGIDFLHTGAYIDTMAISGAMDEELRAAIAWKALLETEGSAGAARIALGGGLFSNGAADVQVDADPYKCQSFNIELGNNIGDYGSLDAKSAGYVRKPVGLTVGVETVKLTVNCLDEITWDPGEDVPAIDIGATVRYDDGVNYILLSLAGLSHEGTRPFTYVTEANLQVWRYEFSGPPGALVITGGAST